MARVEIKKVMCKKQGSIAAALTELSSVKNGVKRSYISKVVRQKTQKYTSAVGGTINIDETLEGTWSFSFAVTTLEYSTFSAAALNSKTTATLYNSQNKEAITTVSCKVVGVKRNGSTAALVGITASGATLAVLRAIMPDAYLELAYPTSTATYTVHDLYVDVEGFIVEPAQKEE